MPTFQLSGVNCLNCRDIGITGWKTPRHYPLSEIEFCTCPAGAVAHERALTEVASRKRAKLAEQFAQAGIPAHFQGLTLTTLRELAGSDPDKQAAITAAALFLATGSVDGKTGLYVYGSYGTGKTGLLTPVLRDYLERGKVALWIEFYDLVDTVQASYSRNDGVNPLDSARACDVLLLDDVGDANRNAPGMGFAETADRQRILYQLVNHRHNHQLPTLITTNLTPAQFAQQFGMRTFERIGESCAIVALGGRNLRRA